MKKAESPSQSGAVNPYIPRPEEEARDLSRLGVSLAERIDDANPGSGIGPLLRRMAGLLSELSGLVISLRGQVNPKGRCSICYITTTFIPQQKNARYRTCESEACRAIATRRGSFARAMSNEADQAQDDDDDDDDDV